MVRMLALLGVCAALPALAQDQTGINQAEGVAPAPPGGAAQAVLAQDLFAIGMAAGDALIVLAAAKLAAGVALTDAERVPEKRGAAVEGAAIPPPDAAAMFADATALAGENETLVDLIEEARADGSQHSAASRTLGRLAGGQEDVFRVPFFGQSPAEVAVIGDAGVSLRVSDEHDNTVCEGAAGPATAICRFTPAWNGYFSIALRRGGKDPGSYALLTN